MDSVTLDDEVTDLPANELAVSIHFIARKIFSPLQIKDLINCRLVSKTWKIFSTPFLRSKANKLNICAIFNPTLLKKQELPSKSIQIEELITILKKVDPPGTFPCTKFQFDGDEIFDENRDNFLNEYGLYIDDLSITIHRDKITHRRKIIHTPGFLQEIENMIITKLPNVKSFTIGIDLDISIQSRKYNENSSDSAVDFLPLLPNDPEFQLIQQNTRFRNVFNMKLTFLEITFETSACLLEKIIQFSPNLQEMVLNVRNCDIYTSPLNRLHLLKKLCFRPGEGCMEKLKKLASFAILAEYKKGPKLLLKEIHLDFVESEFRAEFCNVVFQERVVDVLYDILRCSQSSLEVISWDGKCLANGIIFPQVMPHVREIKLMGMMDSSRFVSGWPWRHPFLFPAEFNFSETLPKLRFVQFYSISNCHSDLSLFLNYFNFHEVPSVEEVKICWKGKKPVTERDLKWIRRLFPNATVLHSGEVNESLNE